MAFAHLQAFVHVLAQLSFVAAHRMAADSILMYNVQSIRHECVSRMVSGQIQKHVSSPLCHQLEVQASTSCWLTLMLGDELALLSGDLHDAKHAKA